MTVQYLRKASLIVGDNSGKDGSALDLSALRFSFAVRRGDIETPNSADIRVYNLSDATAKKIMQLLPTPEFTRVVLQAGYDGNFGVIFDGTIKQIRHGRESQTDTYLDISAADGDSAYNFAVSAVSLAAGSKPADHIAAILQDMAKKGVSQGYSPDLPGNPLPRGKVIYGMSRDALRGVARNTSSAWSIQDGKVDFIPLTSYKPGEVAVINSTTGMIGLPEQTQNGIRIKTLLNPNLKIGQAVQINNASVQQYRYNLALKQTAQNLMAQNVLKTDADGVYYVMVANHSGDTRGNDWYTDLICLSIDATMPFGLIQQQSASDRVGQVREFG